MRNAKLTFSFLTILGRKGQVGRHTPKGVSVYIFWAVCKGKFLEILEKNKISYSHNKKILTILT